MQQVASLKDAIFSVVNEFPAFMKHEEMALLSKNRLFLFTKKIIQHFMT
jgi:hypothetical protein